LTTPAGFGRSVITLDIPGKRGIIGKKIGDGLGGQATRTNLVPASVFCEISFAVASFFAAIILPYKKR
jgi:hypothetical protein